MPTFYFRTWTKWAGVNFPICPSTGEHFMDFSKGFLKSILGGEDGGVPDWSLLSALQRASHLLTVLVYI